MSKASDRLKAAIERVETDGLPESKKGNSMGGIGAYAKALVATLVAVVGGFVSFTLDSSAGGSHVTTNEAWTIASLAVAALAAVYLVPNKPSV